MARGMNERIQKLRELSVTTPVHIDLERARIETDFYRKNDGKYSIPVMRAMVLKEYFSKPLEIEYFTSVANTTLS